MKQKKIFISAAEPSGDLIAAEVMTYLSGCTFIGIGGEQMIGRGLKSFFPMSELTVMGFSQVIPRALSILKRIRETADYILKEKPDVVLTVDAYSFHNRLAKKLRRKGYKGRLVQYVPPAVWAWKASRAQALAKYYDHVFCIFPFEPKYFEDAGLSSTYVGHPAVYRVKPKDPTFRTRFNIPEDTKILMILPGSRKQEITKLLPIYLDSVKLIFDQIEKEGSPKPRLVLPTFSHFEDTIRAIAAEKQLDVIVLTDTDDKFACFHETSLAIAASGTVALELASYGVPTIIGYVTSGLNYWIAKKLVTVKYICTVNIIADKPIVPELIQHDCTPKNICEAAMPLLQSSSQEITHVIQQLKCPMGEVKTPQNVVSDMLFCG